MIVTCCSRQAHHLLKYSVPHQPSRLFSNVFTSSARCVSLSNSAVTRTQSGGLTGIQSVLLKRYPLLNSTNTRHFSTGGSAPPIGKGSKQSPLPFMVMSFAFCAGITALAYAYSSFKKKEEEEERKKREEEMKKEKKVKGKALIGGPFTLINTEGETVTDKNFLGQWALIYFGFTFCPDICPEELEKIGEIVDLIDKTPSAPKIQPVFISVDPKRDTPELIKSYLLDFHPRFIGLTGTRDQVKRATKAYRVYFSEGPDQAEGANEYIVDHSIVTFLVDPKGEFAANFGQRTSPEEAVSKIVDKMNEFYHGS